MIIRTKRLQRVLLSLFALSFTFLSCETDDSEEQVQSYISLPVGDDGTRVRWYYYGYYGEGSRDVLFGEHFRIGETFIKNGKTYRWLHFFRAFFLEEGTFDHEREGILPAFYQGIVTDSIGIRESDGRIFVDREAYLNLLAEDSYWRWEGDRDYLPYEQTNDGELIIYDFTKKTGEKFVSVIGHEDITVVAVETLITRDGIIRHMQRLSNGYIVVEGIGCINSLGMWLFYLNPAVSPCKKCVMMEMFIYKGSDNSDILFRLGDVEIKTG